MGGLNAEKGSLVFKLSLGGLDHHHFSRRWWIGGHENVCCHFCAYINLNHTWGACMRGGIAGAAFLKLQRKGEGSKGITLIVLLTQHSLLVSLVLAAYLSSPPWFLVALITDCVYVFGRLCWKQKNAIIWHLNTTGRENFWMLLTSKLW